jgi:DNA (cytosine-5)-methyltransferase 1
VLFADDAGERPPSEYRSDAFGFYWTEGLRGLGWAQDAVPTLKGGSTIGIPSPPGIWVPDAPAGRRLVMPGVDDAEALQGFERGWTAPYAGPRSNGARLKMAGNAVTVGVARWLGERLAEPGEITAESRPLTASAGWPRAAWGDASGRYEVLTSEYPRHDPYTHLTDVVDVQLAPIVSLRAARGFLERARRAKLRFRPEFLRDVERHADSRTHDDVLARAG